MRDPARIDTIMNENKTIWLHNPPHLNYYFPLRPICVMRFCKTFSRDIVGVC